MLPESGVPRAGAQPHVQDGGMQAARRPATRRLCLGVFAAAALIAIFAEVRAQTTPGDEAAVLAADQSLAEAMRNGDRTTARRLLSLQFTYIDENGKLYARKAFLDDLKGVASAGAEPKVKIYGGVAMVTGRRKTARESDAFFIDIWARQRGAWRVLNMQDVVLAADDPPNTPPASSGEADKPECKNPCQAIPYRVRSPAEQDVINAFQAIENAAVAHDAEEWAKHVADEFVVYGSGRSPLTKAERVAAIEQQKQTNTTVTPSEVETMRLSVYGDGAAMIATHAVPNKARLPYHAARVWIRRNGQWQLAISVQTEIKDQ
jgi:hypothetical protein